MGSPLTDGDEPRAAQSYGDIFDELFPDYLLIGMTPEQYWDGESSLKVAYRKAYRQRRRNEDIIADRNAWLQGVYVRDAIDSLYIMVAGFTPKGTRAKPYPSLPRMEKEEQEKRARTERKAQENQTMLAMAMMQQAFANFNKGFERRRKQQAGQQGTDK